MLKSSNNKILRKNLHPDGFTLLLDWDCAFLDAVVVPATGDVSRTPPPCVFGLFSFITLNRTLTLRKKKLY